MKETGQLNLALFLVFSVQSNEQWKTFITILFLFSARYITVTTDVLTSVKKMEESLKRLKQKKKSESKGLSDDDKIRLQLKLDVVEFGNQVCTKGAINIKYQNFAFNSIHKFLTMYLFSFCKLHEA